MTSEHEITIDPEFRGLCPPLSDEEYQQLEANLLADGCREPLVIWEEDGVLMDGHNRYKLCQKHALAFTVYPIALPSREDAFNWIITNQLGRRNLTAEQKSYLRGKRYLQEQKAHGAPPGNNNATKQRHQNDAFVVKTKERLAQEYHVGPATIERDGEFATALDVIEEQIRTDIRDTVLKRQERGKQQPTKKQVTHVGKLVQEKKVAPLPFMQRPGWKPYQVLQAIEILGTLPQTEHEPLNRFLDGPFIPANMGIEMLKNLQRHTPEQRAHIYALSQSQDPREQSLATTLAADKVPEPDPQILLAGQLIRDVDDIRNKQRRNWIRRHPEESWIPDLEEIDQALATIQERWEAIGKEVDSLHRERIASHAAVFKSHE